MNQFSKRAARRLIQRAFVLVARDKHLRQHIREARLTTLWVLEDWNFAWTAVFDRGRIDFERRPARQPDLTLSWRTAQEFFDQVEDGVAPEGGFQIQGKQEYCRLFGPLLKGFLLLLRHVIANPVDDAGESLL
jgi:hypothetical protein